MKSFSRISQGLLVGAGIGVLAAKLTGHNDGQSARKAMVIGGIIGGGAGALIDRAQKKFAKQEDRLAKMAEEARAQNAELTDLSNTAQTMLASDEAAVQKLKADIAKARGAEKEAAEQLRLAQVKKMKGDLELYDTVVKTTDQRLADSRKSLEAFNKQHKDADSTQVASAVDEFEQKSIAFKAIRDKEAILLASIDTPATAPL